MQRYKILLKILKSFKNSKTGDSNIPLCHRLSTRPLLYPFEIQWELIKQESPPHWIYIALGDYSRLAIEVIGIHVIPCLPTFTLLCIYVCGSVSDI